MSKTINHFDSELEVMRKTSDSKLIIEDYVQAIKLIAEIFVNDGHSGASAEIAAPIIARTVENVLLQKPLAPIYGIDEEWRETSLGDSFQNRRDSRIFKEKDGSAHFIDAIIWRTPKGICYHGSAITKDGKKFNSSQKIKQFPFVSKTFYIDVDEEEVQPDWWEFWLKDESLLQEVSEYYDLEYVDADLETIDKIRGGAMSVKEFLALKKTTKKPELKLYN